MEKAKLTFAEAKHACYEIVKELDALEPAAFKLLDPGIQAGLSLATILYAVCEELERIDGQESEQDIIHKRLT